MKFLANICFICGFLSIGASIAVWYLAKNGQNIFWQTGDMAHGERFGIFIGLWAPTFFILSERFEKLCAKANSSNSV